MNADAPTGTVLIVDDERAVRDSLTVLLESAGFAVRDFGSADAFLTRQPIPGPCCIILDVRLPGMSGLELQEFLTADSPPVVMISGHADVPMAVRAMKQGALHFLQKPFDSDILIDAVTQALELDLNRQRRQHRMQEARRRLQSLTARERQVMELIAQGLYNKVIASRLDLSLPTVEVHRKKLMDKLGAESLSDVIRLLRIAGADEEG